MNVNTRDGESFLLTEVEAADSEILKRVPVGEEAATLPFSLHAMETWRNIEFASDFSLDDAILAAEVRAFGIVLLTSPLQARS